MRESCGTKLNGRKSRQSVIRDFALLQIWLTMLGFQTLNAELSEEMRDIGLLQKNKI